MDDDAAFVYMLSDYLDTKPQKDLYVCLQVKFNVRKCTVERYIGLLFNTRFVSYIIYITYINVVFVKCPDICPLSICPDICPVQIFSLHPLHRTQR